MFSGHLAGVITADRRMAHFSQAKWIFVPFEAACPNNGKKLGDVLFIIAFNVERTKLISSLVCMHQAHCQRIDTCKLIL